MKLNDKITLILPFYLFVIGVFLLIVCPYLLSEGMFMDGLIYSTIAKHLADGIGTFWNPHFTSTFLADFHQHPPLAFGLQSILFTVFGESRYIDKLYSLLTFVITGYIIVKIWKTLRYKHAWFPLFLWLLTPVVTWACSNNMLESTLSIFTSLSILFYLKSQNNNRYLYIFLSGIMLALGFLTKGFVAFFPWTFPFLLWILLRKVSFRHMLIDSLVIIISSAVPLILLVLSFPEVKLSLHKYFDNQIIYSLQNVITVDTRLFIIKRLHTELIPAICLCSLLIIGGWRTKFPIKSLTDNYKPALVFILLGLTGVLPIMISMKQSGFYILATYPCFAIGLGILMYPLVDFLFNKIDFQSRGFLIFKCLGYLTFFLGIILSLYFSSHIGRDKNKINDTHIILRQIPDGSIININPNLFEDWGLHGYYSRYKNVSLDANLNNKREYLLVKNDSHSDTIEREYNIVPLQTKDYKLYKRK